MPRLSSKVAIVTGGASGIGDATCRLFVREGAKVVIADRDRKAGLRLEADLNTAGRNALFHEMDVTDAARWPDLIEATAAAFGGLHVLVNNAGISYRLDIEATDIAAWDKTIAVDQTAVFYGMKFAIAKMKTSREPCSIVNVSSIEGLVAEADFFAYCAAKGAVTLMTKAAALHCGARRYPIRVNSVHPGYIMTPMAHDDARQAGVTVEEYTRAFVAKHPIGHLGEPADIANGILYLASDESKFVSGSQLVIDGAYTAQ
jgi:3(or 17)beta-hydroxysteroid dehydrogenase